MRIELLEGSYLSGIVEPNAGQSKITATCQVYRGASVEAADTRNLPSLAITVGSQEAIKFGGVDRVLPLPSIPAAILTFAR